MLTQLNPGTLKQVRQVHNKAHAVYNKLYYGKDANGVMHTYRGTSDGRLKEETSLIAAEVDIVVNNDTLEVEKASKCFALAMGVIL